MGVIIDLQHFFSKHKSFTQSWTGITGAHRTRELFAGLFALPTQNMNGRGDVCGERVEACSMCALVLMRVCVCGLKPERQQRRRGGRRGRPRTPWTVRTVCWTRGAPCSPYTCTQEDTVDRQYYKRRNRHDKQLLGRLWPECHGF